MIVGLGQERAEHAQEAAIVNQLDVIAVSTMQDAVEFLLAGATGLAVGTALFLDPNIPVQIIEGLRGYLARKGKKDIGEIIGALGAPAVQG